MVLVDTSIWIAHFRKGMGQLAQLLEEGQVVTHPFVIGELACGNLHNRREILDLLSSLYTCETVSHEEVLDFIECWRLMGAGLGYVDIHLLASAKISQIRLWTLDRKLRQAAAEFAAAYER